MKLKDGFVLRQVAGEYVVIPSGDELDLNVMITLNETGSFLWNQLSREITREQLVEAVLSEYEVSAEMAELHVDRFIEKLKEYEFLE